MPAHPEKDRRLRAGDVFTDFPGGPEMVVVPAGTYMMGSFDYASEQPVRQVQFHRPFALSVYPITFDNWDHAVAQKGLTYSPPTEPRHDYLSDEPPRDFPRWARGRRPVINVSWFDAADYAKWLGSQSGKDYRLPSESEWEYACRAGSRGKYNFEDEDQTNIANGGGFDDTYSGYCTSPVGSFAPNAFGLYDMHGNVWEWVQDARNDQTYNGAPIDGTAFEAEANSFRILRGGSWKAEAGELRSSARKYSSGAFRYNGGSLGFRVARTLTAAEVDLDLINFKAPIREADVPGLEPQLQAIQGNALSGHGRSHSAYLFFRFEQDKRRAKLWTAALQDLLTSAWSQLERRKAHDAGEDSGIFRSLMLSADGYRYMGLDLSGHVDQFSAGMKGRRAHLKDSDPTTWESAFQHEVHGAILLADHDATRLDQDIDAIRGLIGEVGSVLAIERGKTRQNANGNNVEPFGFVDGPSNPLFFENKIKKQADGYDNWSRAANPDIVLRQDPHGKTIQDLGSYVVFRKLEQNVQGFRKREKALGDALGAGPDKREWVAANIIGRFRDGTPLVVQGKSGMTLPTPNNFNYKRDPDGARCPYHAHIRKMNPRGEHMPLFVERLIQIVRRGIPYGDWDAETLANAPLDDLPSTGLGLHFVCYQAVLEDQFEFLQHDYANDGKFLYGSDPGLDPLVGQGPVDGSGISYDGTSKMPIVQKWPRYWNDDSDRHVPFSFNSFVTLRGGEYFFTPSFRMLRDLGASVPERGLKTFGKNLRTLIKGLM